MNKALDKIQKITKAKKKINHHQRRSKINAHFYLNLQWVCYCMGVIKKCTVCLLWSLFFQNPKEKKIICVGQPLFDCNLIFCDRIIIVIRFSSFSSYSIDFLFLSNLFYVQYFFSLFLFFQILIYIHTTIPYEEVNRKPIFFDQKKALTFVHFFFLFFFFSFKWISFYISISELATKPLSDYQNESLSIRRSYLVPFLPFKYPCFFFFLTFSIRENQNEADQGCAQDENHFLLISKFFFIFFLYFLPFFLSYKSIWHSLNDGRKFAT